MKNFLLSRKLFITTFLITNLFLFSITIASAATKTWNGGTGGGKDWNTGPWLPVGAPAANDDIVFNTAGTITFTTMPGNITYNSLVVMQGTVNLGAAVNMTITIGGVHPPDPNFEIIGGAFLTIGTNTNITLAAGANARVSGDLIVNAGQIYNTDGTSAVTSVFGTINNHGTVTCTTASKLQFQSFSNYVHSQNGGNIPTATWDPTTSNIFITGLTTTHFTGGNQTFGNVTYDCAGMSTNLTMTNGMAIAGDFTVNNTGSARLLMTAGSLNIGFGLNVNANFTVSNTTDRTLTVGGDVFISGGGNLDLCSGGAGNIGTMNVGGNFTSFGAITETGTGKGVINFNGGTAQNFNQAGALVNTVDFGINNTAGVTFSNSTTIIGALTLTNGILRIPSGTTLTIANGNPIGGSGFGPAKHINTLVAGAAHGFVQVDNMTASVPYTIPTGNGTVYLPTTLTPPTLSSFSVGVFTGITEDGLPNGTAFTAAKKQKVVDAVWTVNRNSGTGGVTMTLAWPASLEGSTFSVYTTTQIGIAHFDNPAWGNSVGTGDNSLNTATRTGITVFSPFGVGKTPYLLPIKFNYLNAGKANGYNTLNWKAACSSSEVTFDIERSTDGRNFNSIGSITATQARCGQPFDFVDNSNLSGTVFYRIKSTEITGMITYSTIVKITDQQNDMRLTAVLPNPVINEAQLNIITNKKETMDLVVVSMEGKVVQHSSIQLQAGSSNISLDVTTLQKGIYMIRGTFSNGQASTVTFTKQ